MITKHNRRSVEFLWNRQNDFYKDRPLLAEHNQSIANLTKLLVDEIEELNGHEEDGMSVEQYRLQEIADIGWFTISLAHMLQFQLTEERVNSIVATHPIRERGSAGEVLPLNNNEEETYEAIKGYMEIAAAELKELPSVKNDDSKLVETDTRELEKLKEILDTIFGFAWALSRFVGQDLDESMMEKLARNNLKHQPGFYSKDSSFSGYEEAKVEASRQWKEQDGNRHFYAYAVQPGPLR